MEWGRLDGGVWTVLGSGEPGDGFAERGKLLLRLKVQGARKSAVHTGTQAVREENREETTDPCPD